jgi:hypothetical protein
MPPRACDFKRATGAKSRGESRCRRLDAVGRNGSPYRSALQRKDRRLSLTYYVREVQGLDQQVQIWKITDDEAICLVPTRGSLLHYRRESGETIWDAIRRQGGWGRPDVHELKVAPGHYFPRIARPMIPTPPSFAKQRGWQPSRADNENAIASAKVQFSTLVRQLELICETVHPEKTNLEAYGYDIRNLLILACTEVESHWSAVLKANGLSGGRWTTRDYVALKDAMKLNEFAISFPDCPWIKPVAPFKNWDDENATRTLPWYDAYNATKHDRESKLKRASLRFAFDAVAGCAIMIVAQFGEVFGFDQRTSGSPRTFFWIRSGPDWGLADCYAEIFESRNNKWTPINYPLPLPSLGPLAMRSPPLPPQP